MLTNAEISDIVSRVAYHKPGWRIAVGFGEPRPYIQIVGRTNDKPWSGRKWFLSYFMTTSEVVQTCLKAILTAEEHEAREHFTYRGHAIFNPHICVETLCRISDSVETREGAMFGT